jgi:branched-subunit amino acid transport protein AzlD
MDSQTYNLIISILGLVFTVLAVGFVVFANQSNKRANGNVPPEIAKTLADALPPSLLPLLIALAKAGQELALTTATTADDELLTVIQRELTPTPHVDSPPVIDPEAEG